MRALLTLTIALACASCASPARRTAPAARAVPTTATIAPDRALQAALEAVVADADGTIAVSVVELDSGAHASIHGDVRLPMMSVFKLPLTIVALAMVDEGKLRLDQRIPLTESELRPTVSPIAEEWMKGEHAPALETMLRRVIQDSDNTVGDKLVTLEGGGPAITSRLRTLGVHGVDIAEQEIEVFGRLECAGAAGPTAGWTVAVLAACTSPTPAVHRAAAEHEIAASPNAATTDALASMLVALDHGTLLSARSRGWLLDTLAGTTTGPRRLKALLPSGTRVEHKTGTGDTIEGLNIATNDVGIVTLPSGRRVAIAVLTAGSRRDADRREATIARLGRVAWEHFAGR